VKKADGTEKDTPSLGWMLDIEDLLFGFMGKGGLAAKEPWLKDIKHMGCLNAWRFPCATHSY